jgi:hypothetical protein
MPSHSYLVFGLHVASVRALPSLLVSEDPFFGEPDVEISEGEVELPTNTTLIDGIRLAVDGESCFLSIEQCGTFQVLGGRKIVIQADPAVTPEQVNLYLLGSVFGVLLHQRRLLPFHCNAVEIEGSAFLFCGESGAGKSTLAAYFVDRGFRLLSDDLCALRFEADGRLLAAPGPARLKLWRDTLELFRKSSDDLQLVPWYEDKFEIPLIDQSRPQPVEVAGIYHLRVAEDGLEPGIFPLEGLQAANAVTSNVYRRRLGDIVGATRSYLEATGRIVNEIPVFTINRNWGLVNFRDEAEAAEEHMRQVAAQVNPPEWIPSRRNGYEGPARA